MSLEVQNNNNRIEHIHIIDYDPSRYGYRLTCLSCQNKHDFILVSGIHRKNICVYLCKCGRQYRYVYNTPLSNMFSVCTTSESSCPYCHNQTYKEIDQDTHERLCFGCKRNYSHCMLV